MRACIFGGAAILLATAWLPAMAEPASSILTPDQIEAADPGQLKVINRAVADIDRRVSQVKEAARAGQCATFYDEIRNFERIFGQISPISFPQFSDPLFDYLTGGIYAWLTGKQPPRLRRSQEAAVRYYLEKAKAELRALKCPPDTFVLHLDGGLSSSVVVVPSVFGTGTTVDVTEHFVVQTTDRISGFGFQLGAGVNLPGQGYLPGSTPSVFGGFRYASGSASSSGFGEVLADGVTKIGHTFLEPDGAFGTGVSTSTAGNYIDGSARVTNIRVNGNLGYRETFQPTGPLGPSVSLGVSVAGEVIKQDFSAESRIYDPTPPILLSSQETSAKSSDTYFGVKFEAGVVYPVATRFSVGVNASITPLFHDYTANMSQVTTGGYGTVSQAMDASGHGFTFGASAGVDLTWLISEAASLTLSAEVNRLGSATAFMVPPKPDAQPGGFDQDYISILQGMVQLSVEF